MNLFCFGISAFFLTLSILFIKKRSLDFKGGLLWLSISLILMIFSMKASIVEYLAKITGIIYAPAFLFVMGIVFSLIMIFYLMIVVSKLQKKITRLIQETSILKDKLQER